MFACDSVFCSAFCASCRLIRSNGERLMEDVIVCPWQRRVYLFCALSSTLAIRPFSRALHAAHNRYL